MFTLITDNKLASSGVVTVAVGVILLLSASTIPKLDAKGNDDTESASKKRALNAIGGSLLAVGLLMGIFDQYTRRFGRDDLSSFDLSSSEMSSADLESFQKRVADAASNLRKSMEDASARSSYGEESSAELAARASAQISSFIQNYS